MATTKLKGNLVNLSGNELNQGDLAPIVSVTAKDLTNIQIGGQKDKLQVFVVVPSLDTPVCAAQARKFNEEVSKLENVELYLVSQDLPFAMGRFCIAESIENLTVVSDFRNKEFSSAYGVLISDGALEGLSCRAVFIVNTQGEVAYKEISSEITEEPDYKVILEAINSNL